MLSRVLITLCSITLARCVIDVAKCDPSNSTLYIDVDNEPITFKQSTESNEPFFCNYTIVLKKFTVLRSYIGEASFLSPDDYIILTQYNSVMNYTVTVAFNNNSNDHFHYFLPSLPVNLTLYIASDIGRNIWSLYTYYAEILAWNPEMVSLSDDVGQLFDTFDLDDDAVAFLCSEQTKCSPTITSLQLPADYKEFNDGDITFLDYYYFYVDDVFQATLSDYINLVSDPFFVHFESRSNITIINAVQANGKVRKFNVILLFSANAPNLGPPEYNSALEGKSSGSLVPRLIHLQEYGQIQLEGDPEAVYHMIAEPDYNIYSTSYVEKFSANTTDSFDLLKFYANCALLDSYKTRLASVTPENSEEWRYLLLRGRCRTFYVRGKATLQVSSRYQGAMAEVKDRRSLVFLSDNYLSGYNQLERDSLHLCFKSESGQPQEGVFRVNLNSNNTFDNSKTNVFIEVDGSEYKFTPNSAMEIEGSCLNISYTFSGPYNFGLFLSVVASSSSYIFGTEFILFTVCNFFISNIID